MEHNTRKKRHLQRNKNRERRQLLTNCVRLSVHHAYRRTTEPRATDLMKAIKTKIKQNKKGHKLAALVANQLSRANQDEHAFFGHSRHVPIHTTECRSPALAFSPATYFAMKRSAPCSSALRHSPSSWATVVHWSALIPKALRSWRRHPIHSFSCPSTQPALPISPPNITQFWNLASSMLATNPTNRIHLLRVIASIISVPVFTKVQIGYRVVGAVVLSSTDAASQKAVVGSSQRLLVARALDQRGAAVQHYLEYLGP